MIHVPDSDDHSGSFTLSDGSSEIIRMVPRSMPESSMNRVISDSTIHNDQSYRRLRRVLVIGCGGVGSNLIYSLARLGYSIAAIDDDTLDDKFLRRFIFNRPEMVQETHKLEFVANVVKSDLNVSIETFIGKLEKDAPLPSNITTFMAEPFICVCATDSVDSRKYIESYFQNMSSCKFFIHVGCNLNSVSIFRSARGLINEPIQIDSSYDTEPNQFTYISCIQEIIGTISNIECNIDNDLVSQAPVTMQISNSGELSVEDRAQGFFELRYRYHDYICKGTTIGLNQATIGRTTRPVKSEITRRTTQRVIIMYDRTTGRTYTKYPDMRPFMTPHTMMSGYQCTGHISEPRTSTMAEYKRFLNDVEASIQLVNFNSLASHTFGTYRMPGLTRNGMFNNLTENLPDSRSSFMERLKYLFTGNINPNTTNGNASRIM